MSVRPRLHPPIGRRSGDPPTRRALFSPRPTPSRAETLLGSFNNSEELKEMKKVIFLDFDGVLNSHEFMARVPQRGICGLDPLAVQRLNVLIRSTQAKVVVSSTWRLNRTREALQRILDQVGFQGSVLGMTPESIRIPESSLYQGQRRGFEIQWWLDNADRFGVNVGSYVIIDDDSDMVHLLPRLVKTQFEIGLTEANVEQAIEMLETPIP